MENYNKFLRNIADLIEKGLFSSRDLKKEIENVLKFKLEGIANKLNLVSREEFEVQKKLIEKLHRKLDRINKKKNKVSKKIRILIGNLKTTINKKEFLFTPV